MDFQALKLSLILGLCTAIFLIPIGIAIAFYLQARSQKQNYLFETLFTLPLVLPPTVLGYYLLISFGQQGWLGKIFLELTNQSLVFSFTGILLASIICNIPFAWLPILRAFEAIPQELKDASKTCGLSQWQALWKIELPLAWRGILTGFIMTFTHTLGEFGVVLMVGGNIPNQTRTVSISIYDSMQSLQMVQAGHMALFLLVLSFVALIFTQFFLTRSNSLFRQNSTC
jgi:molybdate transport system permease protein